MVSMSRLCMESLMACAPSSSCTSVTRKVPSRESMMASKIPLTWCDMQAKSSWGSSTPCSTNRRPTRSGVVAFRAASTCACVACPSRTITSARASRGSSLRAPRSSPSSMTASRCPAGVMTRSVPEKRACARNAMRSARGKPERSPLSTTRPGSPGRPSTGVRTKRSWSGPVGHRAQEPSRPSSNDASEDLRAVSCPCASRLNWGSSPHAPPSPPVCASGLKNSPLPFHDAGSPAMRRCSAHLGMWREGAAMRGPLALLHHRLAQVLLTEWEMDEASVDQVARGRADARLLSRPPLRLDLVAIAPLVHRLLQPRAIQPHALGEGEQGLQVQRAPVRQDGIVQGEEGALIPCEQRGLRGDPGVRMHGQREAHGAGAQVRCLRRGHAIEKRRGRLAGGALEVRKDDQGDVRVLGTAALPLRGGEVEAGLFEALVVAAELIEGVLTRHSPREHPGEQRSRAPR